MSKAGFQSPQPGKKGGNPAERPQAPRLSRKRDIFLAFTIVSLPLLVIAILLLAFVFLAEREIPDNYTDNPQLPLLNLTSSDAFYTRKDAGDFLLVGSWASNFATLMIAPFMLLFSYAVAREVALQSAQNHENPGAWLPLLQEILRGTHVGIWHWLAVKTCNRDKALKSAVRAIDFAALGLFLVIVSKALSMALDHYRHADMYQGIGYHWRYEPEGLSYLLRLLTY